MVVPRKKEIISSFRQKGGLSHKQGSSPESVKSKEDKVIVGYEIILGLCDTMVESPLIQDRRSAAIVLTVRCQRSHTWKRIPPDIKNKLKASILGGYFAETDKSVRNAISGAIVAVAKRDFIRGKWNRVMDRILAGISSDDRRTRQISLSLFHKVTDSLCQGSLRRYYIQILQAFQGAIIDRTNGDNTFIILKSLYKMSRNIGPREMDYVKPLLSNILLSVKCLATKNKTIRIYCCFDILIKLMEVNDEIINPHIEAMFDICVQIFTRRKHPRLLRIRSMELFLKLLKKKGEVVSALLEKKVLFEFVCQVLITGIGLYAKRLEAKMVMGPTHKTLKDKSVEILLAMAHLKPIIEVYLLRCLEPFIFSPERKDSLFGNNVMTVIGEENSSFIAERERTMRWFRAFNRVPPRPGSQRPTAP